MSQKGLKGRKQIKSVHIGNVLDKPGNFNALLEIRKQVANKRPVAIQRPLTPRNYSR